MSGACASRLMPGSRTGGPGCRPIWRLHNCALTFRAIGRRCRRRTSTRKITVKPGLTLRCLEVLAELALANGDVDGCITHADQLLALATRGDMRALVGQAHRLRGLAWLAVNAFESAQNELTLAVTLAEQTGRGRLAWECHGALARVAAALGDGAGKKQQRSARPNDC